VTQRSIDQFLQERGEEDSEDFKSHSAVVCLAEPGVPVVFVSDEFITHTGYSSEEVIGRSLDLLQGPETEPEAIEQFRELIKNCQNGTIRITNYRKNGELFVHECELRPIRDESDVVTHFIAIQRPI